MHKVSCKYPVSCPHNLYSICSKAVFPQWNAQLCQDRSRRLFFLKLWDHKKFSKTTKVSVYNIPSHMQLCIFSGISFFLLFSYQPTGQTLYLRIKNEFDTSGINAVSVAPLTTRHLITWHAAWIHIAWQCWMYLLYTVGSLCQWFVMLSWWTMWTSYVAMLAVGHCFTAPNTKSHYFHITAHDKPYQCFLIAFYAHKSNCHEIESTQVDESEGATKHFVLCMSHHIED